ncbi:AarF/ABC1/UbiB kinase family protein [Pseudohalioglobus sediminis]|uniref:AarF/ABC1/UbiB kinase family protein n=2 Tax=Pseudohalioglobus sediminis TaxID=2606449 RepID=A0A5B0WQS7_9GAMM|nr:AarF/ABC1/UbiB kinase family protein [Pseudohalioglobus sediminis]
MASGVAGGMLAEGTRQLRAGKRPRARDMLMTPANARRVADQLATMRGAAMKVGQILSMDAGDFLPRELADILARLRADARYMPPGQLDKVMTDAYGEDWEAVFYGFQHRPLAAASIGQVHRAVSPDGREIVLKVQYPGVAGSIDADVDNIAALLRVSGLLPTEFNIQPLLDDAKAQLKDEADYNKEAEFLAAFGDLLAGDERFLVPEVLPDLTRQTVLAMTYVSGEPIESIADLPQEERDAVMTSLVELMFRELFELRMVQTDPNFANYQYNRASGKIVLLDFGATRRFKAGFANAYRSLVKAAIAGNEKRLVAAAEKVGYAMGDEDSDYRELVLSLFLLALEPLQEDAPYDFARSDMANRMSAMAEDVTDYRDFWQAPPTDAVYFHRKLGGMFLLASRLRARVNVHALIKQFL